MIDFTLVEEQKFLNFRFRDFIEREFSPQREALILLSLGSFGFGGGSLVHIHLELLLRNRCLFAFGLSFADLLDLSLDFVLQIRVDPFFEHTDDLGFLLY